MKREVKYVDVSVCKSNIKSKNSVYYGVVQRQGRLNGRELLQELAKKAPYIDIPMMQAGMEKMMDVIFDLLTSGFDIDFFDLGIFSLQAKGKLEVTGNIKNVGKTDAMLTSSVTKPNEKVIEKSASYDISESVDKNVEFAVKFSPSKIVKKSLKNVKMGFALLKRKAPLIKKIENALPENDSSAPSILKIKGNNLKVQGDDKRVGIYIEEKSSKELIKVSPSAIMQNEDKTLLFMLPKALTRGCEYSLSIATQYVKKEGNVDDEEDKAGCVKSNRTGEKSEVQLLRVGAKNFTFECEESPCKSSIQSIENTSKNAKERGAIIDDRKRISCKSDGTVHSSHSLMKSCKDATAKKGKEKQKKVA